ncbi:MAG: hypothetical protein JJD98_09340 [Polaromonas sp.]|nr:hypothetical protein [Polaromonas sp.]
MGLNFLSVVSVTEERQDVPSTNAGSGAIVKVQVNLVRSVLDAPRGSYYVPLSQPLGNLVLAALEPDTQSSYFANQILENLQSTVRVMAEPNIKLEELP